jgi:Carbohydrate-selective porin, OprB family
MNNGIDGNPQALPVNTQFSAYPWAVWAARVRIDPTPELNAMVGVYQISDRIFDRSYHGVDWSMRSNDSILLISQIGWTPEFFKRPVPVTIFRRRDEGRRQVDCGGQVREADSLELTAEGTARPPIGLAPIGPLGTFLSLAPQRRRLTRTGSIGTLTK